MIGITAELANHEVVKRLLDEMPERLRDVTMEAANAAASIVKRGGYKLVPETWNVPKEMVKDTMKTIRAKAGDESPTAIVTVKSGNIPLFKFTPDPSSIMGGKTTGGVSVLLGGRRAQFPNAFVAEMASGHRGIFTRTGKFGLIPGPRGGTKTEGIKELFAVSVPQMTEDVGKHRIPPALANWAQAEFKAVFLRSCDAWLAAKGAK